MYLSHKKWEGTTIYNTIRYDYYFIYLLYKKIIDRGQKEKKIKERKEKEWKNLWEDNVRGKKKIAVSLSLSLSFYKRCVLYMNKGNKITLKRK